MSRLNDTSKFADSALAAASSQHPLDRRGPIMDSGRGGAVFGC